ncbi:oligosaccharide flippase family protein [Agrobacterium vitis]|uniref:Oligosaccharide flippase family protein n=1 Tax=Agrobacterium vitis TaxID=373 RepID=A0A6A9UHZ1_AGRVI|nr:lipopolysaccharide biosynthesis protein [Agrobacterium vitis]MCE6077785.1 oligosaccharide flippase family protein [Agrobacterium vitis]MCF1469445.1 lipopolysaccharide biosynthesis protein [Agrobacterium vitis]MCM2471432.1 lipopolysaccharide biosynthesis protein [Agrobacterium vitis]MUO72385.1 oligosaccharide flippase family protein [Agrobacterium vitis]MUO86370.1 oligosaccharide flippase family protein [Agrobacterium vitis]
MPPTVNAKSVTRNVGWSVLSKTGTFGLKFVTVPILARILTPDQFGAVAVALTVVQFLAMIGGAGFGAALVIQEKEEPETIHSVFWANLIISCLMATLLYVFAEPISAMLGAVEAAPLVRIMAVLIPLQLTGDVAYALLARRMQFSQDALWSMISESAGALIAVGMALMGYGVMALVAQLFSSSIIRLCGLFYVSGYVPGFAFKPRRILALGRFSLGMMGSEIANFITFQSPMVVISRYLGLSDAGAYSAANRFSSIPNQVVLSAVMGVLFPAFSTMMHDRDRRSQALMLSTQVTTVLLAPMMFGMWALAEPAMLVLFGPQWAWAWPVLGLLALSKGILTPCSTFIPYLKGVGHGGTLFWWAVIRAIVTTVAVAVAAAFGNLVDAMVALCVVNVVVLFGYSWVVFRADQMPFLKGMFISTRPMVTALIMAGMVRALLHFYGYLVPNPVLQVLIGGLIGGTIYGVFVVLTEAELLRKLKTMVRNRRAVAPAPAE